MVVPVRFFVCFRDWCLMVVVRQRHMQTLLFLYAVFCLLIRICMRITPCLIRSIDRFLHSIIACRTILDIKEHASDGSDVILDDIQIADIGDNDGTRRNAGNLVE
jgi:hypothetical protein